MKVARRVAASLLVGWLAACAAPGGVSHQVDYCCGPKAVDLSSYTLQFTDMPGFLVPYMRDALTAALTAKGMHEVSAGGLALVTLSYSEIYPDAHQPIVDDGFGDPLATERSRQFVAVVTLDIRRASDSAEVLRGSLSRLHTVTVGDYMHERARSAIRAGFDQLLNRLPRS